ncbi:pantoate--beta-alanine ligase [Miltoncostaea marina]|uniref:pantoate--beta-alanine ligase n=1 Tax=Miltoncostaea marina TaxID=2843215 RepID=UPI001C3DD30A|nr:pantoate--beta-alanine ligase [Miltoncostaea marina]
MADLRQRVAAMRAAGRRIAVVMTMGAFHEGHLDLMRRAGADGHAVVVTLFVNPTQFGAGEDLAAYPRDEARDVALASRQGVELVFAPDAAEVYPEGFATAITVGGPSAGLEGAARPHHFAGVATVVAKLLLMVRPDRAVFGQKDAQQVAVVRRLMTDLHLDDVELVVAPTTREADGLAMSSRNAYLGPDDRAAAPALSRALRAAEALVAEGERDAARIEARARAVVEAEPRCELEYATVVDRDTFRPLARLDGEDALLVVAARVGPARLIDNVPLPNPTRRAHVPPRTRTMLKSKIHRATVTDANLNYVGSVTVDTDLLEAADIRPYEHVCVLNINTGARFETYAIEGPAGGGDICLNGAAARLAQPGDLVIILTYAQYDESELEGFEPVVVHVDSANRQVDLTTPEGVPVVWEQR